MRKPNHTVQINKFAGSRRGGHMPLAPRRPFWFPASSYYVLAIAAAAAIFFLIWAVLHEGNEELPWIPAGFAACIILGGAVFLREIILRRELRKFLLAQKRIDDNLKNFATAPHRHKLTLQQHTAMVRSIRQRSEAARLNSAFADRHWEVFEICEEYMRLTEAELKTVSVGSPRLAALRQGRNVITDLHKFHLLNWAEIESRQLTQETKIQLKIADKLEAAQKALNVLEFALQFYPNEAQLTDSTTAIKEFITTVRVSHWIEQAERAAFKGNNRRAISLYRDALFFLARENVSSKDRELVAEKINIEIEKIRENMAESQTKLPRSKS